MSGHAPTVTVVMPVRNGATHIASAVRSIQRQTLEDFELLIIDNGSTDPTADEVARVARHDPRVHLIEVGDIGLSAALNEGTARARSDLVARMDADDLAARRRLERQAAEMHANPAVVGLGTCGWRINSYGVPLSNLRTGPLGREEYHRRRRCGLPVILTSSSFMARRRALNAVGGYVQEYYPSDDYRIYNDLATLGEVYALRDRLIYYRLGNESVSVVAVSEMELAGKRIETEVVRGERYPSTEAFLADNRSRIDRWARREQQARERREITRMVANGRLPTAWRLFQRSSLDVDDVQSVVRQVLGG